MEAENRGLYNHIFSGAFGSSMRFQARRTLLKLTIKDIITILGGERISPSACYTSVSGLERGNDSALPFPASSIADASDVNFPVLRATSRAQLMRRRRRLRY